MSDHFSLLVDLHRSTERQGPGSIDSTLRAMELTGLGDSGPLKIADIGCGTGASTLWLAEHLEAEIAPVDFLPEFLRELSERADSRDLSRGITPLVCSMEKLPFADEALDIIWSEGAIYCIGFERGVRDWARFLKPGGVLVASEITWTTRNRPDALQRYWDAVYPQIDTASNKIGILENNGYSPIGYFTLAKECWLENYYRPLENSFEPFLQRHGNSDAAQAVVAEAREEMALYQTYSDYYSYGMYIARKNTR